MDTAKPDDALITILETRTEGDRTIAEIAPTRLTVGPWNPDHQHGGAITATFARFLSRIEAPAPMRLARMTVEMFRGVPLTPLRVETRIVRGGRRIQSSEATLFDGDVAVARATALRIRETDAIPELRVEAGPEPDLAAGPPPPEERPAFEMRAGLTLPGFLHAIDFVPGRPRRCGEPATTWSRLRCRVAAGEDPSPIERLAAVVDFASGTGNAMDYERYTSINPDLSVHVLRPPRSEWIAIRGLTHRAGDGIGQSEALVHDLEGPIARVAACLLLDRR